MNRFEATLEAESRGITAGPHMGRKVEMMPLVGKWWLLMLVTKGRKPAM